MMYMLCLETDYMKDDNHTYLVLSLKWKKKFPSQFLNNVIIIKQWLISLQHTQH
jgi:hypothetical protein